MCCLVKWIVGCGLRIVLIIVNFPILIFGFTILATGIVMNNYGDIVGTTEESAVVGAGFLIVVGSILTIVGFTGVCGAFCNTDLLIKIYALIQILTFLLSLGLLIAVPIIANDIDDEWKNEITYHYGQDDYITEKWDSRQSTLQCCGVDNYLDYRGSNFSNTIWNATLAKTHKVPKSCCKDADKPKSYEMCQKEAANSTTEGLIYLYSEGCYNFITTFEAVLIGFLSSTLVFLVINAIVACCLLKMNKDD